MPEPELKIRVCTLEEAERRLGRLNVWNSEHEAQTNSQKKHDTRIHSRRTQMPHEQRGSTFFSLPAELRLKVYEFAFRPLRVIHTDDYLWSLRVHTTDDIVDMSDVAPRPQYLTPTDLWYRGEHFRSRAERRELNKSDWAMESRRGYAYGLLYCCQRVHNEALPTFYRQSRLECCNAHTSAHYGVVWQPLDVNLCRTIRTLRTLELTDYIEHLSLVMIWMDCRDGKHNWYHTMRDIFMKSELYEGALVKAFPNLKTIKLDFDDDQGHYEFIDDLQPHLLAAIFNDLLGMLKGFHNLQVTIWGIRNPQAVQAMKRLLVEPGSNVLKYTGTKPPNRP